MYAILGMGWGKTVTQGLLINKYNQFSSLKVKLLYITPLM